MSSNGAGTTIIIPARLDSTRLPGKLLLRDTGKPLIQHTWEQACRCQRLRRVVIATDSTLIADAARTFGAEVVMTGAMPNGTARCHAAARFLHLSDVVINVQADEPEVNPQHLDQLALLMQGGPLSNGGHWPVGTLTCPLQPEQLAQPSVVKAIVIANRALYFSRAALAGAQRHIGVYAYQPYALKSYVEDAALGKHQTLARAENLEQLAFIESGWVIGAHAVASAAPGIDTAGDYEAFVARQRRA